MTTINDLIKNAQRNRLFKEGSRKVTFKNDKRVVELEISKYAICSFGSMTYYVKLLSGFLSNHELITICDNNSTDIKIFHHYGGYIEQLDECLAVTVYKN